jgi:hypothetical protein
VNPNAQPPPGNHSGIEPGHRLIEVDVEITFHRTLPSGDSWSLTDSSGTIYDTFSYATSMSAMPTSPGSTESNQIWYEVPQALTGLTFEVQLHGDSAIVPLG